VETFVTQEPLPYDGLGSPTTSEGSIKLPMDAAIIPKTEVGKDVPKTPGEAIAALVKAKLQGETKTQQRGVDTESPHLAESDLEAEDRRRARQVGIRAMVAGIDFGGLGPSGGRSLRLENETMGHPATIYEGSVEGSNTRPGGFLLTGSEDRKLRLWDLSRMERSIVISGLETESDKPSFRTVQVDLNSESQSSSPTLSAIHTESRIRAGSKGDRPAWRTTLIGLHQQQLLKGHQDGITALACLDVPFRCGIVSGDRMGVVKVFRVETE